MGKRFIETIKVGEVIHNAFNLTKDIDVFFSLYRENNQMFFFSRSRQEVIAECFSHPDFIYTKTAFCHSMSPFYLYNDTVCFYDATNGDIFTIDPEDRNLKPRYQWDFGINNFDVSILPDDKDRNYYMNFLNYGNDRYVFSFLLNAENDNYFITRFRFQKTHRTLLYNKKTKQHLFFHAFKEGFQCLPFFMNNEYMYAVLSPNYLPMIINEIGLNEENGEKLEQIKPDDNPVFVRYKFKNND
jgi:hypothetical protein